MLTLWHAIMLLEGTGSVLCIVTHVTGTGGFFNYHPSIYYLVMLLLIIFDSKLLCHCSNMTNENH